MKRRALTHSDGLARALVFTVLVLACVLGIAAVSRLFVFEQLTLGMLLAVVGLALVGLLWFEGVKWALGRKGG